jgi:hypothetical protein
MKLILMFSGLKNLVTLLSSHSFQDLYIYILLLRFAYVLII